MIIIGFFFLFVCLLLSEHSFSSTAVFLPVSQHTLSHRFRLRYAHRKRITIKSLQQTLLSFHFPPKCVFFNREKSCVPSLSFSISCLSRCLCCRDDDVLDWRLFGIFYSHLQALFVAQLHVFPHNGNNIQRPSGWFRISLLAAPHSVCL